MLRAALAGPGPSTLLFRQLQPICIASSHSHVAGVHVRPTGVRYSSTSTAVGKGAGSGKAYKGRNRGTKVSQSNAYLPGVGRTDSVGSSQASVPAGSASASKSSLSSSVSDKRRTGKRRKSVSKLDYPPRGKSKEGVSGSSDKSTASYTSSNAASGGKTLSSTASNVSTSESHQDTPMMMPPPPSSTDTAQQLLQFNNAITVRHLPKALKAWGYLLDAQATSLATPDVLKVASEFVSDGIRSRGWDMARIVSHKEDFARLADMAVSAASHDHWEGLHDLLLSLLELGRPSDAVTYFDEWFARRRIVQGVDPLDLRSPDRAKRLAARISGDGVQPLVMVHIAALTMLDRFGKDTIMPLLDTQGDWRFERVRSLDISPIRRILSKSKSGAYKRDTVRRFLDNVDKLSLAVMCYHPVALRMRIHTWADAQARSALIGLYEDVMEASLGPKRFIVPQDPNVRDQWYYDVVPLPSKIWHAFLDAFGRLGEIDLVMRVIDIDMPARYPSVPISYLASAMKVLGWIARHAPLSGEERTRARDLAEELWRRIVDRGGFRDAQCVGTRIDLLQKDGDFAAVENLYEHCRRELYRDKRWDEESYVDVPFFLALVASKQITRAMELVATRRRGKPEWEKAAYQRMIRHPLAARNLAYEDKRQLFFQLLKYKPADIRIYPLTWGVILRFLLEGGNEFRSTCMSVLENVNGHEPSHWYANLLHGLLRRGARPGRKEIEAATHILELLPLNDAMSPFRLLAVWWTVLRAICVTDEFAAAERHELIARALASCPVDAYYANRLKQHVVSMSLQRPDPQGVPEAMYYWREIDKSSASSSDIIFMLDRLVAMGYAELAREIVEGDVEDIPLRRNVFAHARSLGIYDGRVQRDREGASEVAPVDVGVGRFVDVDGEFAREEEEELEEEEEEGEEDMM